MKGHETKFADIVAIRLAREAYDRRDGKVRDLADQFRRWEALWDACDFSWDVLGDAGLRRPQQSALNVAEEVKRWIYNGQRGTLQDYWARLWDEQAGRLRKASVDELKSAGLLVEHEGRMWHVLHRPETKLSAHPGLIKIIHALLDDAGQDKSGRGCPLLLAGVRATGLNEVFAGWASNSRWLHVRAPLAEFADWGWGKPAFGDGSDFSRACFSGSKGFQGASFGDRATFIGALFTSDLDCKDATFGVGADFSNAIFGDDADFSNATFGDGANFGDATFRRATFIGTQFKGALKSNAARFTGKTAFGLAEIIGPAGFADCVWPEEPRDVKKAFEGCRFRDVADFKCNKLKAFALFDGAEFKGRLLLEDPGAVREDSLFYETLAATLKVYQPDREINALMGGLRTLKLAMASQGDRDREQRFFRYEVRARANRTDQGPVARFVARAYGVTSDYGTSIGRPLLWLGGVIVTFAAVYWAMGHALGLLQRPLTLGGVVQALEISLSASFKPFSLFDTPREEVVGFWADVLRRGDWVATLMRVVGLVQSLIAIILLFLSAVALRRTFQIG